MKNHVDALKASSLFSQDHLNALRVVEEDMRRATYVSTAGKAVELPTYQNFRRMPCWVRLPWGWRGRTHRW